MFVGHPLSLSVCSFDFDVWMFDSYWKRRMQHALVRSVILQGAGLEDVKARVQWEQLSLADLYRILHFL